MCGRYTTNTEEELLEIRDIIKDISIKISEDEKIFLSKEISPTCIAPIITNNKELKFVKWGFTKWDNKGVIFNARSEAVEKSNYFKNVLDNRCVIPAKCYYEWMTNDDNKKSKYQIEEEETLYMAGLYKNEKSGIKTYTILTKQADDDISFIHNRMPVLLKNEEVLKWLEGNYNINEFENNNIILEYYKLD